MTPAIERRVRPGWRRVAVIVAVRGAVAAGLAGPASCTGSNGACSTPESFAVYAPAATVSAIPQCTSATTVDASAGAQLVDGGSFESFAGASSLSPGAIAECASLCSLATASLPCCRSAWEPNTVLCTPQCQPP